jgi:hypothetical protein
MDPQASVRIGVALGGLIATRGIFVLWLPIALFVPRLSTSKGVKALLVPKAACVLGCLLIAGPWWVRNVAVTRALMPFGTEGALNMPVGFGPRALRAEGVWHSNREDGSDEMWARYQPDLRKFELELAKYRQRLSLRWMRGHPWDVVRLMWMHVPGNQAARLPSCRFPALPCRGRRLAVQTIAGGQGRRPHALRQSLWHRVDVERGGALHGARCNS